MVGHCRDTLQLGTAGILCGWALRGYSVVEHCKDTLQLGSVRILCGWALQGYSKVGHCRDTLRLGTAGILCGWALQGYSAVGRCRDTLRLGAAGRLGLGTAGILCGWALQGYSAVGHCRDTWWLGTAGILGGGSLKSASSRARTTSTLKSNNPTARVGNNQNRCKPSNSSQKATHCKKNELVLKPLFEGALILLKTNTNRCKTAAVVENIQTRCKNPGTAVELLLKGNLKAVPFCRFDFDLMHGSFSTTF